MDNLEEKTLRELLEMYRIVCTAMAELTGIAEANVESRYKDLVRNQYKLEQEILTYDEEEESD